MIATDAATDLAKKIWGGNFRSLGVSPKVPE